MNIAFPGRVACRPHGSFNIIICAVFGTIITIPVCAADFNDAQTQIRSLEETLSGQSKAGIPLLARVDALETLVFGQPSTGALKERIVRLKQYLGREEISAKETAGKVVSGKSSIDKPASKLAADKKSAEESVLPNQADSPPIKYDQQLQKLMTDAIDLYHKGKLDEARSAFEYIFSRYPNCVDACFDLGALAEKRGDIDTAISYYSKAQYLNPDDEQIQESLARLSSRNNATASNDSGASTSNNELSTADPNSAGVKSSSGVGSAGSAHRQMQPNQGPSNYEQAFHTALNAGRSIFNYTLNRALSSIPNF